MDLQEKREFIKDLSENVLMGIDRDLPNVPDNWDGYELRQWLADRFARVAYTSMGPKRLKAYRNTLLISNLD